MPWQRRQVLPRLRPAPNRPAERPIERLPVPRTGRQPGTSFCALFDHVFFYFACAVTSQRAAEERGLPALPHVAVVREEKGEQEADAALLRRTVAALRG